MKQGKPSPDMSYLKDHNRQMILLFLEKAKETRNREFISYLSLWGKIDYKKVRAEIRTTINALEINEPIDRQSARKRRESFNKALAGSAPKDLFLKYWECGVRFTFTVGEQQFYKQKGFDYPKRCNKCREQRRTKIAEKIFMVC